MQDFWGILVIVGCVGVACAVVYAVVVTFYRGSLSVLVWLDNATSSPKSYHAQVVGKRTETSGQAAPFGTYYGGYIETYYFVTFEFKNGARREYEVSGEEYGLRIVGDQGLLTAKGSRYEYFDRVV